MNAIRQLRDTVQGRVDDLGQTNEPGIPGQLELLDQNVERALAVAVGVLRSGRVWSALGSVELVCWNLHA